MSTEERVIKLNFTCNAYYSRDSQKSLPHLCHRPSFSHFCILIWYCWTCSHPENAWHVYRYGC